MSYEEYTYGICDECLQCYWFYLNHESQDPCKGYEEPCDEYIKYEGE